MVESLLQLGLEKLLQVLSFLKLFLSWISFSLCLIQRFLKLVLRLLVLEQLVSVLAKQMVLFPHKDQSQHSKSANFSA